MTSKISPKIVIKVLTEFVPEFTVEGYFYKYNITIENVGDTSVQLLSRHWYIKDILKDEKQVIGKGVVGEVPVILPGESYNYTSGVVMSDKIGYMYGHYIMVDLNNFEMFKVPIPRFEFIHPSLNS